MEVVNALRQEGLATWSAGDLMEHQVLSVLLGPEDSKEEQMQSEEDKELPHEAPPALQSRRVSTTSVGPGEVSWTRLVEGNEFKAEESWGLRERMQGRAERLRISRKENSGNLPFTRSSTTEGSWVGNSKREFAGVSARRVVRSDGISKDGSIHGPPPLVPNSIEGSFKSAPQKIEGAHKKAARNVGRRTSSDLHSDDGKIDHSDLVFPTQGALSTMLLQALSVLLLLCFFGLGGWLASMLLYHSYRQSGFSELALFLPVAICVFKISLMGTALLCKWTLLGRQQPCTYVYWSLPYLKWWFVHSMFDILDLLVLGPLKGTFLLNWWFAALGVRVGHNVTILTTKLFDYDLIELDDNVWVEDGAVLQPHSFTRQGLSVRTVDVGPGCWIGPTAHLNPSPHAVCTLAANTRMPRIPGVPEFRANGNGPPLPAHRSHPQASIWWHVVGIGA